MDTTKKQPNRHNLSRKDKKELYNKHVKLIAKIALSLISKCRTLEVQDLINEGYFGLLRAAELFDENRGIQFSTYAFIWIEHFIVKAIKEKDKIINVNVSAKTIRRINEYIISVEKLSIKLDRKPLIKEIAQEMNTSKYYVKQARRLLEKPIRISSLDNLTEKNTPFKDFIMAKQKNLSREELIFEESLDDLLEKYLTSEEIKVVKSRVGLFYNESLTFDEIGQKIGKSGSRAQQIFQKSIKKIKKALKI